MEIAKQTCQINRRWEPAPKEVTISCPRNETSRAMCHVERTSWIWHAVFGHDPKDGRDTSLQSELHLGNMCIPWCEGHSQHISLQQICTPTGHLQITRNIIDISSPDKIWTTRRHYWHIRSNFNRERVRYLAPSCAPYVNCWIFLNHILISLGFLAAVTNLKLSKNQSTKTNKP